MDPTVKLYFKQLKSEDRNICYDAQLLCNLAKSYSEYRMLNDFSKLLAITKDERFVTARHSLQSIWKIGIANEKYKEMVVKSLQERYIRCLNEKHYTLIRYDIIESLRKLYNVVKDEEIKDKALYLISLEEDAKYHKKYVTVWRDLLKR